MGDPGLRVLAAGDGAKLLLLGDVRTVKVAGADSGGELTIVEQVAAPGAASALHRHPYQEVFYVLEGELEFAGLADGDPRRSPRPPGRRCTLRPGSPTATGTRARSRRGSSRSCSRRGGGVLRGGRRLARTATSPAGGAPRRLSPDAVREAAARHGIEFLAGDSKGRALGRVS